MVSESTALIEAWFREHTDNESDFLSGERTPYSIIPPSVAIGTIIWTTKQYPVGMSICDSANSTKFGMIACYGLPDACDINGLQGFIGKHELLFLGDMDPADLLVFAWLRKKLDFAQIKYLGVGDKYLDDLKVKIPDSFAMQLGKSELAARPLLEKVCPDFRELVGVRGANLLDGGRKIEIEAVVSAMGIAQILPLI